MRLARGALAGAIAAGWVGGASAQLAATTVEGVAACRSQEWLNDVVAFSAAKDYGSIQAYLDQKKCVVMKGGLRVTITDVGFATHEFVYMGTKLYTIRKGLTVTP
jgi:hypothetical protein